ncbi:MAG: DUF3667 domain-containing protein [Schleiferiaceae bacterium]|jgi:hypothetical protein|nr:DUF3667 domain-containing protein [Schleiferiaceae bacterium]
MYRRKVEKGENCLNCGTDLHDENFCPNCGQVNNQRKPTIFDLFFELVSNLFAFDSKFYRSVGPLLFKPGKLSLEFAAGRKQQYMLPIRLFIVVTIIFLFLNSISNGYNFQTSMGTKGVKVQTDSSDVDVAPNLDLGGGDLDRIANFIQTNDTLSVDDGLKELGLEPTMINRIFYHQFLKFKKNGSDDFIKYILSKFLILALLFIPFLAMLLKFFYLNLPKYFYIDHFVFAVHQQTVFFIILIVNNLLGYMVDSFLITLLLILLFSIHFLLALRRFYQERWWLTIFKFIMVNIGFVFVLLIFIFLSGIVTFLLY